MVENKQQQQKTISLLILSLRCSKRRNGSSHFRLLLMSIRVAFCVASRDFN